MTFQALALCQLQNSLWWPVYIINSFDNTKLPCYALQPMQHQFLYKFTPFIHRKAYPLSVHQASLKIPQ